jgi:hypothetical protein
MKANLTTLAALHAGDKISSDEELKRDWLQIIQSIAGPNRWRAR